MRAMLRQGLKRLLSPEPARYVRGQRRATVLAVSSQKGGVGKTTTAVCLAASLARFHEKATVVLDMDAQGHVQTALAKHVLGGGGRLSDVLLSEDRADVLDAISDTGLRNLHLTRSDPRLSEAESLMSTRIGKEMLLRDALAVTRTHYDVIVVDCPPNLGNLTLNALVAADWVIAPCDASPLAVQGVTDLVRTMATINSRLNRSLDLLGVVLTRIDGRNSIVNAAVQQELEGDFGELLFETAIGVDTSLSKSQFAGTSIFDFAPESRAALQYRALADEVAERLGWTTAVGRQPSAVS
jgi:chromosome partitioning protein